MKTLFAIALNVNPNLLRFICALHSSNNADKSASRQELPNLLSCIQEYTAGLRTCEKALNDCFDRIWSTATKVTEVSIFNYYVGTLYNVCIFVHF